MATIHDEIRSKLEAFADDIAALVRRAALDAVQGALGGAAAPAHRVPAGSAPPRSTRPAAAAPRRSRGATPRARPAARRGARGAAVSRASSQGGGHPRTAGQGGGRLRTAGQGGGHPRAAGQGGGHPRAAGQGGGHPRTPGRKAASAARAPGAKRPPAELVKLTEKLGEYIKSNPGQRMEAIGKALGKPTRELNLPIKKLIASKKIRSEGHKRATEYYAV